MKGKRLAVVLLVLGAVVLVLAALPYSNYDWQAYAASYNFPSRNLDDAVDYYNQPYQNLYPLSVFTFDNFGTFTVSALGAGGDGAKILCWSGGKWTANQVENVEYDPTNNTVKFKVIAAPSVCALFATN